MFQPNVGVIDRLFRLVFGIGLMGAALSASSVFESGMAQYIAFILGAVAIMTATLRFCPVYRIIGIRTCDCE